MMTRLDNSNRNILEDNLPIFEVYEFLIFFFLNIKVKKVFSVISNIHKILKAHVVLGNNFLKGIFLSKVHIYCK